MGHDRGTVGGCPYRPGEDNGRGGWEEEEEEAAEAKDEADVGAETEDGSAAEQESGNDEDNGAGHLHFLRTPPAKTARKRQQTPDTTEFQPPSKMQVRGDMQRETARGTRPGDRKNGAAAQPTDNETYFINDTNMVIRPADIDAYNQATGRTEDAFTLEEDQPAAEATDTDPPIRDGRSMTTKRPRGEETTSEDGVKHQRREGSMGAPETSIIQQTAAADPSTVHSVIDMAMEHGTRGVATDDTVATEAGQAGPTVPSGIVPNNTKPKKRNRRTTQATKKRTAASRRNANNTPDS